MFQRKPCLRLIDLRATSLQHFNISDVVLLSIVIFVIFEQIPVGQLATFTTDQKVVTA